MIGRSSCVENASWKGQKVCKIHEKKEHFDENLKKSGDIFNHGEGAKTWEVQCTINRDLPTFLGP